MYSAIHEFYSIFCSSVNIIFYCIVIVTLFSLGMVLVRTDAGQLVMVPQQALAQAQMQAQVQTQGQGPTSISPRLSVPTTGPVFRLSTTQVCLAWFRFSSIFNALCFPLSYTILAHMFLQMCFPPIFLFGTLEILIQIFIFWGLGFGGFFLSFQKDLLYMSGLSGPCSDCEIIGGYKTES